MGILKSLSKPAMGEAMQETPNNSNCKKVQQKKKGIFISQDKYFHEILRKYNYTDVKSASTPTDLEKPLVQDGDTNDVDEYIYRSTIGSLMYLIASRPDIMFAVCACAMFQEATQDRKLTTETITEASLRRHLKFDDHDGITSIPNSEIFEQLALIGYQTDLDKLTFQKGVFSPQWRFLIHTLLHCLSPKKTAWEQFSSDIATALICLATNRKYNFSRLIFEHMVTNIGSPHKFLMYPSNMRRLTKGYIGVEIGLFPTMLTSPTPESSPIPSRITSSPSLSSEPSTEPTFEPQPSPDV
ncbi:hypothetical protein Tco_0965348 [Tanacetum coccineum]